MGFRGEGGGNCKSVLFYFILIRVFICIIKFIVGFFFVRLGGGFFFCVEFFL